MSDLSTRSVPAALVPLVEVVDGLARTVRPLVELVPVREAEGGIVVEDVISHADVPPRDLAARSGHACFSGDLVGVSPQSPGFSGVPPAAVVPGAALPFGTDCVLPPGATGSMAGMQAVFAQAAPGEGVRRRGEDVRHGERLVAAGTRLTRRMIVALEACGIETVRVGRLAAGLLDADAPAARLLRSMLPAAGIRLVARGAGGLDFDFTNAPEVGTALTGCFETGPARGALSVPRDAPVLLPLVYGLLVPLAERICGTAYPVVRLPLAAPLVSVVGVAELVLLQERNGLFEPAGTGAVPMNALFRATHRAVLPPECEGFPSGTGLEAFPL